jgi:hypothetical protein
MRMGCFQVYVSRRFDENYKWMATMDQRHVTNGIAINTEWSAVVFSKTLTEAFYNAKQMCDLVDIPYVILFAPNISWTIEHNLTRKDASILDLDDHVDTIHAILTYD